MKNTIAKVIAAKQQTQPGLQEMSLCEHFYTLGIDVGTQSTKCLLVESENGAVVASASQLHALLPTFTSGSKQFDAQLWIDAVKSTITRVLEDAKIDRRAVRAIGVSGQQHSLVALDANDALIRPAILWCDTTTGVEAAELTLNLGGLEATIAEVGNAIAVGFTASKVLWLKRHEPENFAKMTSILLPHNFVNLWLTGNKSMECGDASGTALFDVRRRCWSQRAMLAVDSRVPSMLPTLIEAHGSCGELRAELATLFGLGDVLVSAGSGDNMCAALGTGNVRTGVVTISLGTSGTIFAFSDRPVVDAQRGEVAAFCDATGHWLPLVCTLNVTTATSLVCDAFGMSLEDLNAAVGTTQPGNDGLLMLPFFEGERTPPMPDATGCLIGLCAATFNRAHFARAAMEGTCLTLNAALRSMRELGIVPQEARVTGGGAKSAIWRQILADVCDLEIVEMAQEESAAFGAALQAQWCWRRAANNEPNLPIADVCDRCVRVASRTRPIAANVAVYKRMQVLHDTLTAELRTRAFRAHHHELLL